MDPTLADREIWIAATWLEDMLVRHHEEALPADRCESILEHAPIRSEPVYRL